ncbi:Retrovirus-related Pol polyprotein from type-1 retrotransposable element R1 [Folsomia candida]|uniref:Retrovirus-related Pol polyprotein from type-1 retrotransposable element R1 n=1 Tax=Folsomia candida TaxID=158441 RepID=A0A226CVQ1_FOLCA|nr:Retrovirus-related Pol polyprotein from type-1 retrotransposable element R1 [Folsomia candida]OXA36991.1 Retrovirus-related Pol polyprotein from type-1 retrotransposable element R1 [Folsomia candida]
MTRGLAQGTLNGPLTFIVVFDPFLKQLQQVANLSRLHVCGFVDDATAAAIESTPDDLTTTDLLHEATRNIKMSLNVKKTVIVKCDFSRTKPSDHWHFNLLGETVPQQQQMKVLGVIINNKLTWDDQVISMVSNASKRFWALKAMKKLGFQPIELVAFYKSSIIPVLEYASPVWGHALTTQQMEDLEKIQCRVLKIIFGRRVKIFSVEYIELLDKNWLPDFNSNNSRLKKKNFFVPFKCNRDLANSPLVITTQASYPTKNGDQSNLVYKINEVVSSWAEDLVVVTKLKKIIGRIFLTTQPTIDFVNAFTSRAKVSCDAGQCEHPLGDSMEFMDTLDRLRAVVWCVDSTRTHITIMGREETPFFDKRIWLIRKYFLSSDFLTGI